MRLRVSRRQRGNGNNWITPTNYAMLYLFHYRGLAMIEFMCPSCSHQIKIKDEYAGKAGKCKRCGEAVRVPDSDSGMVVSISQPIAVSSPVRLPLAQPSPQQVVIVRDAYKEEEAPRIDAYGTWCPHCRNRCSQKHTSFIATLITLILAIFTLGIALIVFIFLPHHWKCNQCGNIWKA